MPDYSRLKSEVEREQAEKVRIEQEKEKATQERARIEREKKELEGSKKKAVLVKRFEKEEAKMIGLLMGRIRMNIEETVKEHYRGRHTRISSRGILKKQFFYENTLHNVTARIYGDINWNDRNPEDFGFIFYQKDEERRTNFSNDFFGDEFFKLFSKNPNIIKENKVPRLYFYFPDKDYFDRFLVKLNDSMRQDEVTVEKELIFNAKAYGGDVCYQFRIKAELGML